MIQPKYEDLFHSMVILHPATAKAIADKILAKKDIYLKVSAETNVPFEFIGCVHYRESSLSFSRHLHNGDPLIRRTVHVPAGRPIAEPINGKGKGYTWAESAIDALKYQGLNKIVDWSIGNMLYQFEKYNGLGYMKYHDMNSPYVWAGTNHYKRGKYASDGKFDPNLVDQQCGCAPILKYLL